MAAERPMAVLTEEQVRTLLDAAAGHRLEALFVLAVTTGMRSGELLGLRWRDVDLVHGNLSVSSTPHRVSRRFRDADAPARPGGALKSLEIGEPKTDRSRRSILLTSIAREALARHRVARSLVYLTAGDDLVFPTLEGRPMDRERLNRRHFLPLLERAGYRASASTTSATRQPP
jgi:integrase